MKNILLSSIIFILVGCSSNHSKYEKPPIRSWKDCDNEYIDICRLFELNIQNIHSLRERNKITHDQAELMIANNHNWAANELTKRFAQINGSYDYEPSQYHDYNADADFYQDLANAAGPRPRGAAANLLTGFFKGMAHGARKKARIQKERY